MAKSYDFYDDEPGDNGLDYRDVNYGDWGSYDSWGDALTSIYEHFTPEFARDEWSMTLFAAGEYDAWSNWLDQEFDVDVDMEAFWEDFREAYTEA